MGKSMAKQVQEKDGLPDMATLQEWGTKDGGTKTGETLLGRKYILFEEGMRR